MFNLAIFDFDGTLADTAPVITATMMATIKLLGLPERTAEQCHSTIGLRLEDAPKKLYPGLDVNGEIFATTYRREWHNHNHPGIVKLYPGALDCLHALHKAGVKLAIGSSRNHESLDEFVETMHLEPLVVAVVGGDDVNHGKPSPEMIDLILSRTGATPDATVMVGDSEFDILAAHAADTASAAVTWGYGTKASLEEAHPSFTSDTFKSLTDWILNNQI